MEIGRGRLLSPILKMEIKDQDIKNIEKILELVNEMHFKDLQGSKFLDKFIILKNFQQAVSNIKNAIATMTEGKIKTVKKKESADADKSKSG